MKVEDQVCTLAQAKKLKELGILQDSLWYFVYYTNSDKFHINIKNTANGYYNFSLRRFGDQSSAEMCSAFTLSELTFMLNLDSGVYNPIAVADQLIEMIQRGTETVNTVNERLTPQI